MGASPAAWLALGVLATAACGVGVIEEDAPLIAAGTRQVAAQADSAAAAQAVPAGPLAREVFAYGGGSRDPFESLLEQANVGPELPDLTLVAVYLDHQNAERNTAVLRERITGRRYMLHPGDRLGRLQVVSIRERAVTFRVDDFGVERRETLSLRTRQEDPTP
jgi:hypothetical protein